MRGARRGFTLIELLIVVVIIGILAAIAIPKFANTKGKAYIATMKSDLRNLVHVQETYFAENSNTSYAASTAALGTAWHSSSGVTITIGTVTATTWDATATHTLSSVTCTITLGGGSSSEGTPICQ